MNTSMTRLLAAALAMLLIVAACASDTGAQWTFAPVAVSEDAEPEGTPTVGDDVVPVEQGDVLPPGAADPETPTDEVDEAPAIPDDVTSEDVEEGLAGEADPDEAADPAGEVEPGEEPSPAEEPGATATPVPGATAAAEATAGPEDPGDTAGEARVIEMLATGALQFTTPEGEQIRDIAVTPGETIVFRVDNTAGFDHNLYIGTEEQLSVPNGTTDVGIPTWQTGVQELEWTVPEDITGLKFGCTVPGHYTIMQGTFSVAA